jgi:Tfp pilus assembly protein PilN
MRRRRKAKELEQINLLELMPVRLATWSEKEGRVVIERPKPTGAGRVGEKLRYWLAVRRIRLDERGSLVWLMLDGAKSVAQVADALREEFGEQVEPAEDRAGQLIRMLHKEDLVAYPGWDEFHLDQEC